MIKGRRSLHGHNEEYISDFESEDISDGSEDQNKSVHGNYSSKEDSRFTNRNANISMKRKSFNETEIESSSPGTRIPYFIALIVMIAALAILIKHLRTSPIKSCNFNELRQRQPYQNEKIWTALTVGIETLLNKTSDMPNVYLFLYPKNGTINKLQTLVKEIANEASACFDGKKQYIEMTNDDFVQVNGDYGYAIEQYKKKVQEGKVFLIVNLNEIQPQAARALHTICDVHTPIAADVVIFLTLQAFNDTGRPIQLARQALNELWSTQLRDNELDPLITRVTDQVLLLQS